jgi:hypothetical protein
MQELRFALPSAPRCLRQMRQNRSNWLFGAILSNKQGRRQSWDWRHPCRLDSKAIRIFALRVMSS